MKNILQEIVDYKKKEITDSKKSLPEIEIINYFIFHNVKVFT